MTSGIIEILIEDVGVQSVVGTSDITGKYKVFPVVCPQKEKPPYIVVIKKSNNSTLSLDKDTQSLLDYPLYDVVCYSKVFHQTELMAEACRGALDNMSSITEAGVTFERIWLSEDKDGFDFQSDLYAHISTYSAELKRTET